MLTKIKHINSLIKEGKHTIALSELIPLRETIEKGSVEYGLVLQLFGSLYYYYAEFTISMEFSQSAIEVFKQHQQKDHIDKTQYTISLIYIKLQKYEEALKVLNRLLNDPSIKTEFRWHILLRKADIYRLLEQLNKAQALYDQLLTETASDASTYTRVLINSAINLFKSNQKEMAKEYFLKAIKLSKELKQARLILYSNMNYASYLAEMNESDKALDLLLQCLEITKENNNKISIKNISTNIAMIYEQKNQILKANKYRKLANAIQLELKKEKVKFENHLKT